MFMVRASQLDAFSQADIDQFTGDVVSYLMTHYPDPSSTIGGEVGVRAFVERSIPRAAGFGVTSKGAVTALLELWIQFGENFERSPLKTWSSNLLSHPILPGAAKVDAIRDRHLELTGGCVLVAY